MMNKPSLAQELFIRRMKFRRFTIWARPHSDSGRFSLSLGILCRYRSH